MVPYAAPAYHIHADSHLAPIEEDFALAIRLQEDELEQYSSRQPQTATINSPQRAHRNVFDEDIITSSTR